MIESSDFDVVYVKNSTTEFVVVSRGENGFVPVIVSENCGLDLMGFVASKGSIPRELRGPERIISLSIRSEVEQYYEAEVELNTEAASTIYFYWKGSMPRSESEFLHACKVGLQQLFREKDNWGSAPQAFFSWYLGPMVFLIERENGYQAVRKRIAQQSRSRLELMVTILATVGAASAMVVTLAASSGFLDSIRSLLGQ